MQADEIADSDYNTLENLDQDSMLTVLTAADVDLNMDDIVVEDEGTDEESLNRRLELQIAKSNFPRGHVPEFERSGWLRAYISISDRIHFCIWLVVGFMDDWQEEPPAEWTSQCR